MMSKEELIDKIKRLLALSSDPSTTEHERDLAYKKAQALMAKYCISNLNTENVQELVTSEVYKTERKLPVFLQSCTNFVSIFNSTAHNFGCYLAFKTIKNEVSIFGFKINIEVLKYILDTLISQGQFDYRVEYSKRREISFSSAFWTGFGKGLDARFSKKNLEEQAIELYDRVKAVFEKQVRYESIEVGRSTAQGFEAGHKSATEAQLNPAVSTSRGSLLK